MSLDVYLYDDMTDFKAAADLCEERGLGRAADLLRLHAEDGARVYDANVTHNLGRMADAAGVYRACWRPEEIGAAHARDLVPLLREGLGRLKADPDRYRALEPDNGWGSYDGFVLWLERYLEACLKHPDARVEACR